MSKKLLVALCAVALLSLSLSSCKKSCVCNGKYIVTADGEREEILINDFPAGEMSKKDCKKYDFKPTISVPGATVVYDIKCTTK